MIAIDAPADEHDEILLDRVALWAAEGPVSFLRANKPVWRLEVIRHEAGTLTSDAADAVADSTLVLKLLAQERDGKPTRPRRELVLRAMRRVADGFALTPDERIALHRAGYAWAVELGRWDDAGMAALEARFLALRDGLGAVLDSPVDTKSEDRWRLIARGAQESEAVIEQARKTMSHHANRLGIFAEAEAILHYLLFRLHSELKQA